ncbi:uncharacterized protein LOC112489956 [Ziziphus jujuba]|uniref:Uncharacterized protein LOC112489956 n=2 Tax=Ziziphus jujuba TaxID=326968 RepID=A0ABM3ICF6_ZIZJJ|nr:uncharacterized protein LOC112489956 [Ziziphus jujuba]XP_048325561.1 uncharacterized protein LOC112489956 [Ziziphus jujuba]KAH7545159.1 hypothetical protein FEM48_Zijuj01G0064100 [Ziziphus jujuba var. spinosa]
MEERRSEFFITILVLNSLDRNHIQGHFPFTATMNFLLTSNRANVRKQARRHSCSYCPKVFTNHQALGGHLRAHQDEINLRRSLNYSGNSSNCLNTTVALPNCLMKTQPVNSSEVSGKSTNAIFWRATPPLESCKSFCTNENGWVDVSKFPENNAGNTSSQSQLSANFSSGSGSSEIHNHNFLSSATSTTRCTPAPSSFPPDPLFTLGYSGVCQFNTDQFRSFRDGMPFSGNILPNFQPLNPTSLPYPAYAIAVPDPSLGSYQLPDFKESTGMVSLPACQNLCSGHDDFEQYNKGSILTPEGKRYSFAQMMTIPKRPKISCNLTMNTEKPQQKELLLLKDMENFHSGFGMSNDAKEGCQTDLDLSLHL